MYCRARAEFTVGADDASETAGCAGPGLLVTEIGSAVCAALLEHAESVVANKRELTQTNHTLCRAGKPDPISIDLSSAELFAA